MSGKLRLNGATSGYSELQAPDVAGDQTFTLPATGGTLSTVGYQQGVWTPTLLDNGNGTTATFDWVDGRWTRIGNRIDLDLVFRLLSKGDATETARVQIGGLPYRAARYNNQTGLNYAGSNCYFTNMGSVTTALGVFLNCASEDDRLMFYRSGQDGGLDMVTTNWQNVGGDFEVRAGISFTTDDTTWTPINGATLS